MFSTQYAVRNGAMAKEKEAKKLDKLIAAAAAATTLRREWKNIAKNRHNLQAKKKEENP